jgi:phosphinothricin acetyltransferase
VPNEASRRLFESRGFEQVATYRRIGHKLGAWRDVGWWQLDLGVD